eukprot:COSAG01_NODE_8753_length_2672_cov_1.793626_1_plen_55_part_00
MNRRLRHGAVRDPWSALQRSLQNAQAKHSLDASKAALICRKFDVEAVTMRGLGT